MKSKRWDFRWMSVLLLLLALAGQAGAEPARLFDAIDGAAPIRLAKLAVHTVISGATAETTLRMEFYNPNPRQLEGHLQFPLVEGQQITSFALDIEGRMRPAVPVEKTRGRAIFEAVERQRVDPALLEQTAGNHFKLRVYPVPAMGKRVVELSYAEFLGAARAYRLPLGFAGTLDDFSLDVTILGASAAPRLQAAPEGFAFAPQSGAYRAQLARTGYRPPALLAFSLNQAVQPLSFVQEFGGQRYFIAEIPLADVRPRQRAHPRVLGLLWDSSGSGAQRRTDAELEVLDNYFRTVRNVEVRLVRLRDRAEAPQRFRVTDGDWSALRRALEATVYDGATALGGWSAEGDVDDYVLVSDGLHNFGSARIPALAAGARLYALASSAAADTVRLAALAEQHGGRLIRVDSAAPAAVAQALLADPPRLVRLEASGAADLLSDGPDEHGGMLRVAGRLLDDDARLHLAVQDAAGVHPFELALNARGPSHPAAARLWATYRIHALEADYTANRAEIRRIGQRFALPTRETSLLVLESLQDYVRFDVEPPPEFRPAFDKLKALAHARSERGEAEHLESVVRDFRAKLDWWKKTYPKGALPQPPALAKPAAATVQMDLPSPPPLVVPASAAAPAVDTDVQVAGRRSRAGDAGREPALGIALRKWTSNAPYLERLRGAKPDRLYALYLDEKPAYANSTAFFLDAADLLFEKGQRDLALRVLSNLAEMELENRHVLRILGYRLVQAREPALAVPVFEQVRALAPDEPQTFRDLGLAYDAAGRKQDAIDALNHAVTHAWDGRFAEVDLIALAELNAIAATTRGLDTSAVDPRLLVNMPLDLRVVLTWDADDAHMDMIVRDPNGEMCFYGKRFTYQGGRMSRDLMGGYGPQEFSLRHAKPGKYKVEVMFFSHRQQVVAGATTLQVKLATRFGTPGMQEKTLNLRLHGAGETVLVGEFEVGRR